MEKLVKKDNGQWDIEKIELNLDDEISGKAKEDPDFVVSENEKRDIKATDKQKALNRPKKPTPPVITPEVKQKIETLGKALEDLKKQSFKQAQEENRGKQLVGVKGYGADAKVGGGPAMTGIPRHYSMGETKSGKPIMSTNGKEGEPYHTGFTAEDHKDAYYQHGIQANELKKLKSQVHPDLIAHHEAQAKAHWDAYQGMLQQKRGG